MDAAPRPSRARHGVLGFALAVMGVAYLDRVAIAMAAPVMQADLGLSDRQLGFVFSGFTLAYALFEVPSGWLADRFGVPRGDKSICRGERDRDDLRSCRVAGGSQRWSDRVVDRSRLDKSEDVPSARLGI
jgi:MFS family permease